MNITKLAKDILRRPYHFCRSILTRLGVIPFSIPYMVITVGQACTYKCLDCVNFAPYSPAKFRRYDVDNIIRWLEHAFMNIDRIDTMLIQGGESFLYSDLSRVIECIHASGRVRQLNVATNGTVIPSDETLNTIKRCNACVRISDYDITPEKTSELVRVLDEKGINYFLYSFSTAKGLWFNHGRKDTPRDDNDRTASKRFLSCHSRAFNLEHGIFARCSRANNAPDIQGFTPKEGDYVYLDRYPGKKLKRPLVKYYYGHKFLEACQYCRGTNYDDMIPPALQDDKMKQH